LGVAAIPIVVDEGQAKMLPATMPKTVSEDNYMALPIVNDLTRKPGTQVTAMGGQVREEK